MLYIPNDCSPPRHIPFLVWGGLRATTDELWPINDPPLLLQYRTSRYSTSGASLQHVKYEYVYSSKPVTGKRECGKTTGASRASRGLLGLLFTNSMGGAYR